MWWVYPHNSALNSLNSRISPYRLFWFELPFDFTVTAKWLPGTYLATDVDVDHIVTVFAGPQPAVPYGPLKG